MTKELLGSTLSVILTMSCQTAKAPDRHSTSGAALQDSAIAPYLRSSGVDRPDIYIELRADKTSAVAADTVHFTLVARNVGPTRIQVGVQCGPAMDIRMSTPARAALSVLNAQFQDSPYPVAFTCELGPYHFANPHDSLVNRLWWKAPALRGEYMAVAGARGSKGLDDVSAPLAIHVR